VITLTCFFESHYFTTKVFLIPFLRLFLFIVVIK
jgi:hypothetical protein